MLKTIRDNMKWYFYLFIYLFVFFIFILINHFSFILSYLTDGDGTTTY